MQEITSAACANKRNVHEHLNQKLSGIAQVTSMSTLEDLSTATIFWHLSYQTRCQIQAPVLKEPSIIFHEAAASSAGASDGAAACLRSSMSSFIHHCTTVNTQAKSHALVPCLRLCIRTGYLTARPKQNAQACAPGSKELDPARHAEHASMFKFKGCPQVQIKPPSSPASPGQLATEGSSVWWCLVGRL